MMKPKSPRSLKGILSAELDLKVCQEKNSNVILKRARASERLREKQKRKELANQRRFHHSLESQARELSQSSVQYENPAHKILFLTRLGLAPNSGTQVPDSLRVSKSSSKKGSSQNSSSDSDLSRCTDSTTSDTDNSGLPGDSSDEQDLELMISPIDIPEIYQEVSKSKPLLDKMVPKDAAGVEKRSKKVGGRNTSEQSARTSPREVKRGSTKRKSSLKEDCGEAPLDLSTNSNRSQSESRNNTQGKLISQDPTLIQGLPIKIPKMQAVLLPLPRQPVTTPVIIPKKPLEESIPCIDLTAEEEEDKDNIAVIRKKLLSLDTILEFADRR